MTTQVNKIILAPMEGVVDALMRKLLCSINHYDLCITEFLRVVDKLEPKHRFYKLCPELKHNSRTSNNTPVRIQLLGQEPHWLAENAYRAIELGSYGVDINFGCPAKTVNKSKGGAVLLQTPELIYQIMKNVRSAVHKTHIVSAKIRLGYENHNLFDEIVDAVYQANTDALTIHARTKLDGYRPPAYWQHIAKIKQKKNFEIIANGEIWSLADAQQCMFEANTNNIMLGRGALALPNLCRVIKEQENEMCFTELMVFLRQFAHLDTETHPHYFASRLKQWLRYLKLSFPQAEDLFQRIRTLDNKIDIINTLNKCY